MLLSTELASEVQPLLGEKPRKALEKLIAFLITRANSELINSKETNDICRAQGKAQLLLELEIFEQRIKDALKEGIDPSTGARRSR